MLKKIYQMAYYAFAYHLPDSYLPIIGKICNCLRVLLCRRMLNGGGVK